jgi:3-oxoacyl-[acyl-carrier protein] reductase
VFGLPLKDKVSLVTGGARGIGRAIALELGRAGSHVAVCDLDLKGAEETAGQLSGLGVKGLAVQTDVTSSESVEALFKQLAGAFGRIDVLVNNAGITRDNLLIRMDEADWDRVIQINLKGAFLCTKQAVRLMMKQRSGKIVNIASVVGVMGNAGQANYAASKAGLIGFTKSVAKEVGSRNVQVNAVAPGFIETDMTAKLSEEIRNAYLSGIPSRRFGLPEEVARVVRFLASGESDYITGQVIHVDGGLVM